MSSTQQTTEQRIQQDIKRIEQSVSSGSLEPISDLHLPLESVSVFPVVDKKLFASFSVRENKTRDEEGVITSIETKNELTFLAGKMQSWPVGRPEDARDYNVKKAAEEQVQAPFSTFESPIATVAREMKEEAGVEWPKWREYADASVIHVKKDDSESYMVFVFVRFPDMTSIEYVNDNIGQDTELRHFIQLPYELSDKGVLTVTEPAGSPELRKFFKKILFKFYGKKIHNEINTSIYTIDLGWLVPLIVVPIAAYLAYQYWPSTQ